ncbi:hypothetical protein Leryth_004462 [Lithospermum erythrorhizon]|nr:hypothetical protein Leryth_004462 [Lithospermum erythrorhizon]
MESAASESLVNSEHLESSSVVENAVVDNNDDTVTDVNNGGTEQEHEFKEADVHDTLEVIAATGKFWHEWDILKRILSYHLKKVMSEYPEAKKTIEQQATSLGETIPVLLKRLDYALDNFIEGPPFTLQRLCEILLVARDIYPNLSKLALALEKVYYPFHHPCLGSQQNA